MKNNLKQEEKTKRFDYIDLLKCIAILFVVIYHGQCYNPNFISNDRSLFINSFRALLTTCVPLFFLTNGYLLFGKELDLKSHTIKIIKLVLITIIWGFITVFLISLIKGEPICFKTIFDTLWRMKEGYANHLWFMGALICIYLIFPILKNTFDTNKKLFIWFVCICVIFTFGNKFLNMSLTTIKYFNGNFNNLTNINFFHIFNPFRGIFGYTFVYFCFGGIIRENISKIKQIKNKTIYAIIGLLISSIGLALYGMICSKIIGRTWDFVWNGYDTIFTFVNTLAIFILCLNYKTSNLWLKNMFYIISKNTMGIYLLHMIFLQFMIIYVKSIPFFCNSFGNIILASMIAIISMFTTIAIKKIPVIKIFKNEKSLM